MFKLNDFKINRAKRVVLSVDEMAVDSGKIAALYGPSNRGKSILLRTIHGLYGQYSGDIELIEGSFLQTVPTYLITAKVNLLSERSVLENLKFMNKENFDITSSFADLTDLTSDYSRKVSELSFNKKKLLELVIACGVNPILLLIDDFDKMFTKESLQTVGKLLIKYKDDGGTILLSSSLTIPDVDASFFIEDGKVVQR